MIWQRRQLCICMLILLVLIPKCSRLYLELTFGSLACAGNQSCARDLPGGPHDGHCCVPSDLLASSGMVWWNHGSHSDISLEGESCGKVQGYTAGEDPFLRKTWVHGDEESARLS